MATVTIRRGASIDRFGNPTGADTETTIDAVVAPRGSDRRTSIEGDERGRNGVIVGLSLYAPPGTVILRTDRIVVNGDVYEVDGDPGVWVNPFTHVERGVEVALRRAEG